MKALPAVPMFACLQLNTQGGDQDLHVRTCVRMYSAYVRTYSMYTVCTYVMHVGMCM